MGFAPLTTTITPTALAPQATSLNHDGTPPVAALTTIWTPSDGCFPVSTRPTTDIDIFWTSNPECAPPGYASYFETYYYSPAMCPSGFTVGCSRYGNFQGPSVEPTETAVLCVMSDYSCTPDGWNYYATNADLSYAQVMIQIRWASSDLSILETHPLTPGLTLAVGTLGGETDVSGTQSSSSTTVTGLSANPDSYGVGLSVGAQVGIGVGVGLFGLLGLGLAIFFILRYRKKRTNGQTDSQSPPMQQPPPGQYPFHQYPYVPGSGPAGQPIQGYPKTTYLGYPTYVDPKTGAATYYSVVPQPAQLGVTAINGPNTPNSQELPPVPGSQSAQLRNSTFSNGQPMPVHSGPNGNYPISHYEATGELAVAEMSGNEGLAQSIGSTDKPQARQEMAHLIAEKAKLDARRTRLMELEDLNEEEKRIRTRMQQLGQAQR
ncbi:hypothetical protein F4813DRAFT_38402 [Daldinia decipiens]|uniref:uncharacterized protein n=1 Tax=Daldinia decipiens TaxID=326647 RepID=UPI0020C46FD3|nr:uncharacterized protein F4813DRAFT_38402 [Daldinia decipiens]KAI1658569.1 hypothetical protein F4813DRAFT_38402 [Daldinia decipiens]